MHSGVEAEAGRARRRSRKPQGRGGRSGGRGKEEGGEDGRLDQPRAAEGAGAEEELKEVEGLADAADRLEVESIMMMMTRMSRPTHALAQQQHQQAYSHSRAQTRRLR